MQVLGDSIKQMNNKKSIKCIINGFWQPEGLVWQLVEFQREFARLGADFSVLDTSILPTYLLQDSIATALGECDAVLYLDKDITIANMLELAGYRVFNSAKSIEICDDKMKTYLALHGSGITIPTTISSPLLYAGDDREVVCHTLVDRLGLPMIIKECFGSFGKQVHKVDTFEQLRKKRAELLYKPHIYQQYINSSCGRDMRLLVIGGKVVCAMTRTNDRDFRSNIELGGVGKCVEPPTEFIAVAENAAAIIGLDYCGIDILWDKNNQPILCEVNSNAYFNTISRICNINVARIYAEQITSQIKQRCS